MHTKISIEGMHCAACVNRLTEAFNRLPGVTSAHVTLSPPQAHIESQKLLPMDELQRAASSAGAYSIATPQATAPAPGSDASATAANSNEPKPSLYPLALIVGYLALASMLTTFVRGNASWHSLMLDFMAGFFLVFSFFKLLNLRGFADAYQSYDILARRSKAYAMVYPFIELALGIAYLVRWQLMLTNSVTLALMLISSIGVLRAVLDKRRIRCACLGTALNLPMTTVTVVEDLGMAAMALGALLGQV